MDLAELGIIFKTEGADAAIAKMEAFEEASDKVEKAEKRRLQAAVNFARTDEKRSIALQNQAEHMTALAVATAKNADQQDRLEERLGRAIASFGQAKSAVFEYDAILIGANERLSGAISKLRELEAARDKEIADTKAAAQALREEEGLLLDIARDIEHMNKVRAKAAADAEVARQKELKDRQEYYNTIIRKAKEAEQAERDARHNAIIAAQDATKKAEALYRKEEAERKATAERAAKVEKQIRDNAVREAEQKAMSEISWAKKSRDEQLRIKEEIAAFRSKGISEATIGQTFGEGALSGTVKEVGSLADKWNHVTFNTSRARSEMIVLAHEAVQGRFSRIPASMMVFAEYTDLSAIAMSKFGLALMGTVAALAAVSIAVIKGILEQRDLQNALITTGNFAGTTEASLDMMAHSAVAMGGSLATAKGVVLELAASGKFTAEQIDTVTTAVVTMEHATGDGEESVKKLVSEFKSLQAEANAHSRYSDEISKAILKLDSQYHFLTTSVFAQIRALEEEGKFKEASALATNAYAQATESRAKEIVANLGNIEMGWRKIKEVIGEAWSAMKDWGKTKTAQDRMMSAASDIESLDTWAMGPLREDRIAEATKRYNDAYKELIETQKKATEEGEKSRKQSEANLAWNHMSLQLVQLKADKEGELAIKIREQQTNLEKIKASPTATPELIAQAEKNTDNLIAAYKKHYAEKSKTLREFSTIELNEQVREWNAQFAQAEKHTNKMVAISQQGYEAIRATEADRFAVVRSNAKAEGELGFAIATEYTKHVGIMQLAGEKALQDQLNYYAQLKETRQKTTDDIIAAEEAQVTRTEQGRERKKAAIDKALNDQKIFNDRIKDLEDAAKERAENNAAKIESDTYKTLNADMNAVIMSLEKKVQKEQEHLKTLTMSKEQIALLAAQEDEALAKKLEGSIAALEAAKEQADGDTKLVRIYQEQIDKIKKIIELREKSKKLNEDTAPAQREYDRIKAAEEAWKKSWESTNKIAQDVFVTWATDGSNAAQKIGDTLKKALLSAIYEATLKPLVFQLYTSIAGGAPGGALGAINGAGSLFGSGSSGLSSTFSALGGNLASGFKAGLGAVFGEAGTLGGLSAGTTALGAGNIMGGLGTLAGTVMPWLAGASLLQSLTGYSVKSDGSALLANLGGGTTHGVAIRSDYTQSSSGIFSGGTTHNSDWKDADAQVTQFIQQQVKTVTDAARAYGTALGLPVDNLDSFKKQIEVSLNGLDAAGVQKALQGAIDGFANDLVSASFGDSLKEFAKSGESAGATLSRVASEFTAVNSTLETLGSALLDLNAAGIKAADGLVQAMGGLEAFNQQMASYYQNFYSGDEQRAQTAKSIQSALADVGLDYSVEQILSATRAQFRALVEAQDLTTDSGRATYAALMKVSSAFANLTPTVESASKAAEEASRRAQEEAQRAAERAAQEARRAEEEARRAAEAYQRQLEAARDYIKGISTRISDFLASLDAQAQGLQSYNLAAAAFSAQMVLARGGDRNALDGITSSASTLVDAIRRESSSAAEANLRIGRVRGQLSGLPAQLSPEQFIVNELGGVITTTTATTVTAVNAVTTSVYDMKDQIKERLITDFAKLDTSVNGLLDFTEFSAGVAGMATDAELRNIFNELDVNGDGVLSQLELISANTANYTGGFDPNDPIRSVFNEIQTQTTLTTSLLSSINQWVYHSAFYLKDAHDGTGSFKIRGETQAFAKGGMFTNSIVSSPTLFDMGLMGEAGPEAIMPLKRTGTGELGVQMVMPKFAQYNTGQQSQALLVEEIRALRSDNQAQAAAIVQLQKRMTRLLERWDGNGIPETRVVTA